MALGPAGSPWNGSAARPSETPGARGKLRKIQSSQKTLHTVVASHPFTVEEVRADKAKLAEVRQWERLTIDWLKRQYGPALKSVIRHTDENQWHIHAYVLPTADKELRAAVYHPGIVAKRSVMAEGRRPGEDGKALNKRSNAAYKAAMREWQDSYHDAVAIPCGLTRLGPGRRRLTREEWKAEMTQARALQRAMVEAERISDLGQAYVERVKAEAATVKEHTAKTRAAAERLQGVGGAIRSVYDGIQQSRIRADITAEFARNLAAAKAAVEKAQAEAAKAKTSQRKAEKQASEQRHVLRQQRQRLLAAQQEIQTLSRALAAALDEPAPTPGGPAP